MFAPWARFMVRMKGCKKKKGEEEKELRKGGRKEVGGQIGGREKGKERRQSTCAEGDLTLSFKCFFYSRCI